MLLSPSSLTQAPVTKSERAVATPSCDGEDHMQALAAGPQEVDALYSPELVFMVIISSTSISCSGKISSLSRRAVSLSDLSWEDEQMLSFIAVPLGDVTWCRAWERSRSERGSWVGRKKEKEWVKDNLRRGRVECDEGKETHGRPF